jgi:hypothetical protein
MSDEKKTQECEVTLCCKATGELKLEVQKELESEDKCLATLLSLHDGIPEEEDSEEDADENSDPAE